MQFVGNDDGRKNYITVPVSGYKTLTIAASNYESGTRRATIIVGSNSYVVGVNETKTINVSGCNSITIQTSMGDSSITWYASYTLSP